MSCCGKGRQAVSGQAAAAHPPHAAQMSQSVVFEYFGATSLTVMGATTGHRYHFSAHGVRLRIDGRDRVQLLGAPNLRLIT
jgi:hypothetical protein